MDELVSTLGSVFLKTVEMTAYVMVLGRVAHAISTLTVKLNNFVK